MDFHSGYGLNICWGFFFFSVFLPATPNVSLSNFPLSISVCGLTGGMKAASAAADNVALEWD